MKKLIEKWKQKGLGVKITSRKDKSLFSVGLKDEKVESDVYVLVLPVEV
jgi:hypothetical protein